MELETENIDSTMDNIEKNYKLPRSREMFDTALYSFRYLLHLCRTLLYEYKIICYCDLTEILYLK